MRIMMTTRSSALQDGINQHILNVVPELNKLPDVDCAVCVVQPAGDFGKELAARGVRVYSLESKNGHSFKGLYLFYRAVKDFKPDFMHDAVTALSVRVVSRYCFPSLRWVSTFHGVRCVEDLRATKRFSRKLFNFLFSLDFKKVFYVSKNCMDIDTGFGLYNPEIRRVGLNPYDFDKAIPSSGALRRELGLGGSVPLIGTACRIAAIKRPDLFTKVMCRVLELNRDAHGVIIGDGPCLPEVKSIIAAHGLVSRFHLLGYRKNVFDLDSDLDCFVMTSELEGMPTAALEAVAAGAVLALMKVPGGITDIIELSQANGDFAVSSEFGDVEALAQGIVRILQDRELRLSCSGRAREICKREFGIQRAVENFQRGYQEMMR